MEQVRTVCAYGLAYGNYVWMYVDYIVLHLGISIGMYVTSKVTLLVQHDRVQKTTSYHWSRFI